MVYKVLISEEVSQAIDSIYDYIATVLLSKQSAHNTVAKIVSGLKELEVFPEAGFNADERVGVKINRRYVTRGKIIGQYVLLYFIDETEKVVYLSHLFHTKSDYLSLLQKNKH
ncbi:plasmid stabilization protein ParE [Streptococcus cuniculi]|uniref:Plasmid stabilization protein ParE n=1 Tax=Streptococcus cuniculi TaxID=1432788 RepID=A0A1Q8E9W9_9STRE|nr:type II toxin-antitoxin system RelE/ParE family toxin [Streptococcus cuniculi]OLF48589.1 plasmid stabilization protein ParE [Streptococcus cuniculi]